MPQSFSELVKARSLELDTNFDKVRMRLGRDIFIKKFWVANAFSAELSLGERKFLHARKDGLGFFPARARILPVTQVGPATPIVPSREIAWGVDRIQASQVWSNCGLS